MNISIIVFLFFLQFANTEDYQRTVPENCKNRSCQPWDPLPEFSFGEEGYIEYSTSCDSSRIQCNTNSSLNCNSVQIYGKLENDSLIALGVDGLNNFTVNLECVDSKWKFEKNIILKVNCRFDCRDKLATESTFVDINLIPSRQLVIPVMYLEKSANNTEDGETVQESHHCKAGNPV
ncbi:hypothetical protein GCK72_022475 [Caenorhabditis remanei]|uniref:Uncharacterized protein n=1 Tax=Caenorhabditis remanei TaxID=31234 RepID=A0A6A5FU00_CAERE|nr:hypothetical protein GCK72_022475 [Caenorhabditis remanei]KAF1746024.1 hypothetical protein GCK72_022475 [Caenorhabditis remanei]